ncbi:D-amino-acid transaminase [Ectobacillus sp. sgz5001026]|uniref:D-amino-acid transaminase n=1 Tax=Ectobacillus sp. sgz5001026 TaxID=3242473 RepID=UPI0036D2ED7F
MEPIILFGSTFMDTRVEQPSISIEDRGLQFGDGIYEVIRIYDGAFHLLEPHLSRLYRSMNAIDIHPFFTKDELIHSLYELVKKNQFTGSGYVYLQISRGVQPRNHHYSDELTGTFYAYVGKMERPVAKMQTGIKACTVEDIRWLHCDIKSLNLLPNVLARTNAERTGYDEALFVRGNGIVTEGSSSNFFFVKDGTLYTHPADNLILNGIARQHVLSLAEALSIPVKEEEFEVANVLEADECFFTSTGIEVTPLIQLDGVTVGGGTLGPISKQLQVAFEESIGE